MVLKRLDRGEMVAQCNLAVGPNAGKGRHQDLGQFRDDLRKALGDRFVQFVGQGEVDGAPAGGFRYKVTVQGRQGDSGVLWHYYLIAGPDGDQLIATFTLGLGPAGPVRRPGPAADRLDGVEVGRVAGSRGPPTQEASLVPLPIPSAPRLPTALAG